jgi:hypothetical protein
MAITRTCDICCSAIDTAGRNPADCQSTPAFYMQAPGVYLPNSEVCLPCLKIIVRTIGERFPHAPKEFSSRMRNILLRLAENEVHDAQWHRDHPTTEER